MSIAERITRERHAPRTVEITGVVRRIQGKGIGVFFGENADQLDERTGRLTAREVWQWLPLAKVEREGDPLAITDMAETITIPEWLAKQKGLA